MQRIDKPDDMQCLLERINPADAMPYKRKGFIGQSQRRHQCSPFDSDILAQFGDIASTFPSQIEIAPEMFFDDDIQGAKSCHYARKRFSA
jgi:hypothetical protein